MAGCEDFGWDVVSNVSLSFPVPKYHIADPRILSQIFANRNAFIKPSELYRVLNIFGLNVVTADGQDWSRHRRISNPAFSEGIAQFAWDHTTRIVHDMIDSDWSKHGDRVELEHTEEPMKEVRGIAVCTVPNERLTLSVLQITLLIIMAAGFGYVDNWIADPVPPAGHSMTFRKALHTVLYNWYIYGFMPKWIWHSDEDRRDVAAGGLAGKGWLGSRMKDTALSYSELKVCFLTSFSHSTGES